MPTNENPAGQGGVSEQSCAKHIVFEGKPSKISRQARSISASGPAELGERTYTRQQLGAFQKRFVRRMLDAISAGTERVSPGVDNRPGTKNPRAFT
jgi:hypothetical protein